MRPLMTAAESLIGSNVEAQGGRLALIAETTEQTAADILARADFDFDGGKCYIRYDGHKATVAGKLTEYGWEIICEGLSISCSVPRLAFEMAVRMRIRRNAAARAAAKRGRT